MNILVVVFPILIVAAAFLLRFVPYLRTKDDVSDPTRDSVDREENKEN